MGKPWTDGLPVVTVPEGTPKPVTVIYPYYENPAFFRRQLDGWAAWPHAVRSLVSFIVVDDGSTVSPAAGVLRSTDVPIRLFEIRMDVRWNWLAARNIGFHYAADGWVLVTDMDHVIPEAVIARCLWGQHDPATIYAFSRVDVVDGRPVPIGAHPNSWLLTREMFWRVGGYDETLSGHYGTDGDWRRRCAATAPMAVLAEALCRYEFSEDSSTTRYLRKQPEDAAVKRIVAARRPGWRPKVLSFPYREVTCEPVG